MKRVWPTVSSSTILVMVTLPIFQRIRRSPCPSTGAPTPTGRYRCRLSILQRARKGAAVEQDVLSGDEARLGAAQEGAGEPELLGLAEAPRRIELGPFGQHLIHGDTTAFGFRLGHRAAQPVGVERSRQQPIDGDVVDHGLARDPRDKAGEAGSRAV